VVAAGCGKLQQQQQHKVIRHGIHLGLGVDEQVEKQAVKMRNADKNLFNMSQ
jgi:hypothetical protein